MNYQAGQLFIFLGPPGAGKGSLSQLCVENFGWEQLSTGHLCRKHIEERTPIGKRIDFFIKSGKLISDELIVDMVEQWLGKVSRENDFVILDGFPRNIVQAKALHKILKNNFALFKLEIFKFFASDDTIFQRLLARYICANQDCQAVYSADTGGLKPKKSGICNNCCGRLVRRSDDKDSTIRNRIDTYRVHEKDLAEFYSVRGFDIREINVEKPIDDVFQTFKNMLLAIQ